MARLRPFGRLEFHASPTSANLTYKLLGETASHTAHAGQTIAVKAGTYEIEARAENFPPQTRTLTVWPSTATPADFNLAPATVTKKETPPSPPAPAPKESPLDPLTWSSLPDGWFTHSGSGYGWLRTNRGTFDIEIRRQSGRRALLGPKRMKKVEWVIDYKNEENQITYSLDGDNFSRKAILGGKTQAENKKQVDGTAEIVRLQVDVTPNQITVRSAGGSDLDVFPRNTRPGELGKFGFKGDVEVKVVH
jgi:hypothetical protein